MSDDGETVIDREVEPVDPEKEISKLTPVEFNKVI
jgi:hypothetical protein